jgi:hypothetical protein
MGNVGGMNVEAFTNELTSEAWVWRDGLLTAPIYGIIA